MCVCEWLPECVSACQRTQQRLTADGSLVRQCEQAAGMVGGGGRERTWTVTGRDRYVQHFHNY